MAQFTEAHLEQLAKMGFTPQGRQTVDYVSSGDGEDDEHDQRVWDVGETPWLFVIENHAGTKFLADDRLSGIELKAGLGVGFDCPIAAATWLLLQEANRV